ncbi:hypothetical protein ABIA33_005405 [Streptacidiphilus sp. MAP12-16]|uniref:hypothetical protein n=1 Tax=Streptacidiphilus sp. MAP12-16 TaxID=3156300 RepID=UPI003514A47E
MPNRPPVARRHPSIEALRAAPLKTFASAFAGLALAGTLLGASAVPASAAGSTPGASAQKAGPKGDGAHGICLRATKIDTRITRELARLAGPVTEAGSIARLQQRVENAHKAGHTAIETYLNDRLTTRKGLVATLTERQADLKQVQTWCAANNNGKAGS